MQHTLKLMIAFCTGWVICWAGAARAADATPDPFSVEKSSLHMACLKVQVPASLVAAAPVDGRPRLFRASMTFKAGESEPTVEWLWKGDERTAALLALQLRGSRMPCLEGADPQVVVQEFWWTPETGALAAGEPWSAEEPPLPSGDAACYVRPRAPLYTNERPLELSKVLFLFRFVPGGEAPEVRTTYRTGSATFAAEALRYVRRYRRCEGSAATLGMWHEQIFTAVPNGERLLKPKALDLADFLSRVKGAEGLRAHFDTNTMNCPFDVNLELYQPARRNRAAVTGAPDLNRRAFLGWLERQQLDLPAAREAALFYETMTITVPCQVLDLK